MSTATSSPPNVLIDAGGRAHVGDFGLAKPVVAGEDMSLTQDGLIVGTPDYLSPEQARGEKVDCRSDIYSLGVVLYEMLGGVPPFGGATPVAIVAHHLHTAPFETGALTRPRTFRALSNR